jgi:prepilin-type N-terminal cleavage/methylation domain-containing protein
MLKCLFKISGCNRVRSLKRIGRKHGFSLLEILVVIVIVGIIGVSTMSLQTSTWKRTANSNRLLVAGQLIEKQIESIRMNIDVNPVLNFPPKNGSISENGIALKWNFSSAYRPKGSSVSLKNTRRCDLTATWGSRVGDTLVVTTYIAKLF